MLRDARAGGKTALGGLPLQSRHALLPAAEHAIPASLRAKVDAVDLLQDTWLEAQGDFPCFHGNTKAEFVGWLRAILMHNASNLRRHYLRTAKRRLAREVRVDEDATAEDPRFTADAFFSSVNLAMMAEDLERYQAAWMRLPDLDWFLDYLCQEWQFPFDVLGGIFEVGEAEVVKLHRRAVRRLRKHLNGHDGAADATPVATQQRGCSEQPRC